MSATTSTDLRADRQLLWRLVNSAKASLGHAADDLDDLWDFCAQIEEHYRDRDERVPADLLVPLSTLFAAARKHQGDIERYMAGIVERTETLSDLARGREAVTS